MGLAERTGELRNHFGGFGKRAGSRSAGGVFGGWICELVAATSRGEDHQPGSAGVVSRGRSGGCSGGGTSGGPLPLDSEPTGGRAHRTAVPACSPEHSGGRVWTTERATSSAGARSDPFAAS